MSEILDKIKSNTLIKVNIDSLFTACDTTLVEVCKELKIPITTLANYRSNTRCLLNMHFTLAYKLSKQLGISLDNLYSIFETIENTRKGA